MSDVNDALGQVADASVGRAGGGAKDVAVAGASAAFGDGGNAPDADGTAESRDKALFADPPLPEDCPICLLPNSGLYNGKRMKKIYKSCCGKTLCGGCVLAMIRENGRPTVCAFCREPVPSGAEEDIRRTKKRMGLGDAGAYLFMAQFYDEGSGVPRDKNKAMELSRKAGELGSASGLLTVAMEYSEGGVVEKDMEQARHYFELAAMKGDPVRL